MKIGAVVASILVGGCVQDVNDGSRSQAIGSGVLSSFELTGNGIWDPFQALGTPTPIGTFSDASARVICPGHGEPSGVPLSCPADSRLVVVGWLVGGARVTGNAPTASYLTGSVDIVANVTWDASGAGREWGTFQEELDAGGVWDGTFEGIRSVITGGCTSSHVPCWSEQLTLVGHGTDGNVDGMRLEGTENITSFGAAFISTYDLTAFAPGT